MAWATSFGDSASFHLERCLGAYPVDFTGAWTPPEYWDAVDIALEMPEHPGLMVAERISLLLVALRLLVLVSICLLQFLLLMV